MEKHGKELAEQMKNRAVSDLDTFWADTARRKRIIRKIKILNRIIKLG